MLQRSPRRRWCAVLSPIRSDLQLSGRALGTGAGKGAPCSSSAWSTCSGAHPSRGRGQSGGRGGRRRFRRGMGVEGIEPYGSLRARHKVRASEEFFAELGAQVYDPALLGCLETNNHAGLAVQFRDSAQVCKCDDGTLLKDVDDLVVVVTGGSATTTSSAIGMCHRWCRRPRPRRLHRQQHGDEVVGAAGVTELGLAGRQKCGERAEAHAAKGQSQRRFPPIAQPLHEAGEGFGVDLCHRCGGRQLPLRRRRAGPPPPKAPAQTRTPEPPSVSLSL
mmetsp:Transcript_167034/g.536346  ORF Transcript_167034/g.536346 Transcript_167034/m.536346 type:complete len:276 (-) Transcript_167034:17-844(-)